MEQAINRGTLSVQVTTSRAQLPVRDATVAVTTTGANRQLLFLLVTDESGLAGPVTLESAPGDGGTTPGGAAPFRDYALWVEHPEYQVALVEQLQIFPGVESVQHINLIPLSRPVWEGEEDAAPVSSEPQDL